jgi:hypothetical protein
MYIFASESINPMTKPIITIILSFFALTLWADDSGKCGNDLIWTYVEETKTLTISGSGAMPNNKNALMEEYPWFYTVYDKTEKVVIEDGVTSIGDGAFYLFSKLTSIEIPNSVKRIGYGAFGSCTSLTSFVLPSSVETLDKEVFYDCRNLTSLIVDGANSVFDSRGSCNAIIKTENNELIQGCATTVIPSDVIRIGNGAFSGCYGLTSITIPQSVSTIGSHAFSGCIQLTSIEIPSSMNGIGEGVFTGCSSMVSVTLPNTITSIGSYAFMECSSLTSIEIPSSVTFINIYAFAHCSSLTSVEIPGNVKELAQGAFQSCKGLQTVKIADGVTTLKYNVFKDCDNLTSVEIAGSVKEIGQGAFQNCSSLTSVKIADGTTTLYNSVFKDCVNLASIEIPTSVTSVGTGIFDNTAWLANHPDGVVYAGNFAYQYKGTMPNNADIELREGTTGITERIFQNCKGMRSIIIPNSVTTIGNYAFFNCTGLSSIEIPKSVTVIGNGAFDSCEGIKTVRIERNTQQIGGNAFAGLYNLTDFYCLVEQVPTTGSLAFDETSDHATLHVPASALDAYKSAAQWNEFKDIVAMTDENTGDDNTEKGIAIDATNFTDDNFRNWVLSQEYGADGVLTNEELKNVTSINISRLDIHNLKGIEYFIALKDLNCMTNRVTSLDLSKNTSLEKLECVGNRMTTINLLNNKKLRFLNCGGNSLTSLDVSNCTELDTLACADNSLISLDVSKNIKMRCLECYSNQLTALDLSNNMALNRLQCNNNQLTTLDVSKNTALTILVCSQNLLTTLDVTKNSALTTLSCMDNKLKTLYMSDNKSLKWLFCFNNQLTSLDVSGCPALKSLGCNDNQLTTLNLSGCSALVDVNCYSNQLTTLDLSENTALTTLFCFHNQIKGTGMDLLVESLPTVSKGSLNVMYFENEQNVMTTTQVAAAKAKGWTSYILTYSLSEEYAGIEDEQDDYLPFVEEGKVWQTFSSHLSSKGYKVKCYFSGEEIKGGKTYSVMYGQKEKETPYRIGLYREENKKVYEYNEESGTEYVIYDFSLKVGDEFTSTIPFVRRFRVESEGEKVVNGYHLRTLRLVSEDPDYNHGLYWIEGLGGEDGPFGGLDSERPGSQRVDIAYVQYINSNFTYLPFYFFDINHEWHGAPALLGEKNNEAYEEVGLKYEIIGSRLHVYGYIWASPGSSNYLFFKEEETDDPMSPLLRVEREYTNAVLTLNMGVYYIDLYSSEYGMYYNYKVVDEFGEHDVVNRNYEYRPFVEDGKAWKVGALNSGNPVQFVEYYYFDGDTIINGKTCKQMMCQQYVNPEDPDYAIVMQYPLLQYVGAWYEEDKKVYFYNANNKQMRLMYDFSLDDNGLFHFFDFQYVVGPKQTGGINGFKGVYREVWECGDGGNTFQCAPWMEGVGLVYGPPTTNVFNVELADPAWYLMSCTVGDEVIYCNSEVDDPFNMGAKKRRFDFNHTIKTQPKTPRRAGELDGLYGEYNDQLLDVKLNTLDEAYLVRITDKSDKVVYEKTINAGNIVALNIDISDYPEGQYIVTIDNSKETFTGEFEIMANAIEETPSDSPSMGRGIYNLQGKRISVPQKGINIIGGKKVWVR